MKLNGVEVISFSITIPERFEDEGAVVALFTEYYGAVLAKLTAIGGPTHRRPSDLMATFGLSDYLPPNGRLTLVQDDNDVLVGGCTFNQVRDDACELKRLFIRPEANGHGLGRKTMERVFEEARRMGLRVVLINVIKENREMLYLCEKMGFRYIERYPECADPSEFADFFVYMQFDLKDG